LDQLCGLGNRLTTTENERKACEYLQARLVELGYETAVEEFKSPTTFSWTYLTIYLGIAGSIILSLFLPLPGLLLFLISLLLFLGEQTTHFAPLTSLIFAIGKSRNVIARGKSDAKEKQPRVWLVAHYDTSKTSLAFAPSSVPFLRPLFLFSLFLLATSLAIIFIQYFCHLQILALRIVLIFSAIYFFYLAMMMLERELRGKPVQGAADNASGVAVAMELARRFQESPLANSELRVLLTGAEEVGMAGMSVFMRTRKAELDRSKDYFVNFDSIGEGGLCYITKEGMLWPLKGSERLLGIAEELAREGKFSQVKARPYTALTLDTLVARSRGFPVISFMALTEKLFPKPWHWFDDTIDKVDLAKLELAADFAEKMIRKFDRSAG